MHLAYWSALPPFLTVITSMWERKLSARSGHCGWSDLSLLQLLDEWTQFNIVLKKGLYCLFNVVLPATKIVFQMLFLGIESIRVGKAHHFWNTLESRRNLKSTRWSHPIQKIISLQIFRPPRPCGNKFVYFLSSIETFCIAWCRGLTIGRDIPQFDSML